MRPAYTKAELNKILSALDDRPRRSRDPFYEIGVHAEQLGLSEREVLETAWDLIYGSMTPMGFRGLLKDKEFGPLAKRVEGGL